MNQQVVDAESLKVLKNELRNTKHKLTNAKNKIEKLQADDQHKFEILLQVCQVLGVNSTMIGHPQFIETLKQKCEDRRDRIIKKMVDVDEVIERENSLADTKDQWKAKYNALQELCTEFRRERDKYKRLWLDLLKMFQNSVTVLVHLNEEKEEERE